MPMPCHMTIDGENQGNITSGCCSMEGREDTVVLFELEHTIDQPRDKRTGRATGKRNHHPVMILKEIDKCSPLVAQALTTNELLTVKFEWYRPNPSGDGTEEHFYSITLEGASLISYTGMLPNTLGTATGAFPPLETLKFAYRKIVCTYETDGIEFQEDADVPV